MSAIPQTLTAEYLAGLIDCSERWIQKMAKEGVIPTPDHGKFPAEETLRALVRHYREKAQGASGSLADEKLAKLRADRQLAEVKLERERRSVADIGEVEDFLKRMAAALDMRFTHEFETVLPPAVIGKDIIAVRQELRDAGDRIRESMRKGILNWKPETQ